ncbi:MAG TPA: hypothetical protein VNU71_22760, partial [Burkholderiaceae bacterium]|nr:hypothetical protein [Burkholderiaceae bacterium]
MRHSASGPTHTQRLPLQAVWALQRAPAAGPGEAPPAARDEEWIEIPGPSTVAAALRALGRWSLDAPAQRFDADDWWFRARFDAPPRATGVRRRLVFGGLAGHCEAWLNGAPLLASDNMHLAHRCAEPRLEPTGNELLLRFASLDAWLARKRPRPRWRAPMVEHQQLRFTRNTLLGRTPGWSPPAAPVGPWRAIEWVDERAVE